MLDKATYLESFHRDAQALGEAARQGLAAPVLSCPGWTVASLLTHLTRIYAHRIKLITLRARENPVEGYDDLDLPPEFKDWFEAHFADQEDLARMPPGLLELFERTAAGLEAALGSVAAEEPVWTWHPTDHTVGFWQRRMAHETAVHRWDVQLAHGVPEPIEPELACDGIDEVFDIMLPDRRGPMDAARPGSGESYHFHRTDGPGEWLVRFDGDGQTVTREHAKGDVAIRGAASHLLLFLWQRIPADRLDTVGDVSLLDRYFELVPPD